MINDAARVIFNAIEKFCETLDEAMEPPDNVAEQDLIDELKFWDINDAWEDWRKQS